MMVAMDDGVGHRFYGEFATWWPMLSPVGDYSEEAAYAATLLGSAEIPVREVLELGSGGGHNAAFLKLRFTMTLVDISAEMLGVSRGLNPECDHHNGDMRTVRLGREFDAVFIHDAIDYMTTVADLRRAVETAFVHCRPGGVVVLFPDHTAETFEPGTDHGGIDGPDGRGARYLEWSWDPDPDDTWVRTDYAFMFRTAVGRIETSHETHHTGLFGREVWLRLLDEAGFVAARVSEETTDDRPPRDVFVGRRPTA